MQNMLRILLLTLLSITVYASDSSYIRRMTDTLASPAFSGRGYVHNGMNKAADFIFAEMDKLGMSVASQYFSYKANSFPGKMSLALNGHMLKPGIDYLVDAGSRSITTSGKLKQADSITYVYAKKKVLIKLVDKLTWTVSPKQEDMTIFYVRKDVVQHPEKFECEVDALYLGNFKTRNVIGVIQGNSKADSLIVITAHYDHLGMMGDHTMFPGANDNAGGVALMLSLAKAYVKRPSPYSIVFIAFAGEEAGLIGSEFFVNNPVVNLKSIRFLLNLDLMGNGDEGITVVNATEFPKEYALLQEINNEQHLLSTVNGRGKARNSDHYWFTERGVPSFFIYTLGKRKAYHDVEDIPATVPWYEANDLQSLLTNFIKRLALQ